MNRIRRPDAIVVTAAAAVVASLARRAGVAACRLALTISLAGLYTGCGGYVGTAEEAISERALVFYGHEKVQVNDTEHIVYAVVVRGRPGWHKPGASSHETMDTWFGHLTHSTLTYNTGTVSVDITYSRLRGTLEVAGRTVKLSEGNVVLVDSVETGGDRLPVRNAGRFDLPLPPGQAFGPFLLDHNPAVRVFVLERI